MRVTLMRVAPVVFTGCIAMVAPGPLAAEGVTLPEMVTVFCDYCADYTDAAVAAGPIRTAYQVGIGYAQAKQATGPASACPSDDKSCVLVGTIVGNRQSTR